MGKYREMVGNGIQTLAVFCIFYGQAINHIALSDDAKHGYAYR